MVEVTLSPAPSSFLRGYTQWPHFRRHKRSQQLLRTTKTQPTRTMARLLALLCWTSLAVFATTVAAFSPREAARIGRPPTTNSASLHAGLERQHQQQRSDGQRRLQECSKDTKRIDDEPTSIPTHVAVFSGYRTTPEDYQRLKSAHVITVESQE